MFSYRSIALLCVTQLVVQATQVQPAQAQAASPPLTATAKAPSDEPPPLEGGPVAPPVPAEAGPTEPAAPVAPAPAPPGPAPCPEGPEPPTSGPAPQAGPQPGSPTSEDPDAVFRAFAVFAASERDRRIVGTVAGVAAGVTTIALGALIAEPTGTDADVWYVIGGITIGTSLLGLLLPSPAEGLARSYRVREPGHTESEARSLEIKWNDYALAAKRRRITGGALSLVTSAFFVGAGIAIATGAGDFTQTDRDFWGSFLIATGATVGVSGGANLFVRSSAERSLEAYRAVRPDPVALRPLFVAGAGGVLAGAQGTF